MPNRSRLLLLFLFLCSALVRSAGGQETAGQEAGGQQTSGEQSYRAKCAMCHGDKGQGTEDEYPEALVGDKSIVELAGLISKTMPKDKVGQCVGSEAEQVAAYMYETFYSPDAQIRNRPPRVELARLTVRQYRQSVTDLLASFGSSSRLSDQRGLKAEYFKAKNMNNKERVIERIDPTVQFDYGQSSPQPDKIDPKEFSMRWQGSIYAPETGEYEIIVRTDNATRLWLNDNNMALIDAWVKSGDDQDHRATVWLLGGRSYGLRLEYMRGKEKTANIALMWKRPQHTDEVISERYLCPDRPGKLFVSRTPFPPDDRSVGYERGSAVSKAWDQATTEAAIEVAAYVVENVNDLAGTRDGDDQRGEKLRAFARKFAERAFRRPLTPEQTQLYIDQQFADDRPLETSINRVVLLTLKSPRFLYPFAAIEQHDGYEVAARLALGLWDSLPDTQLAAAAAKNQLSKPDEVRAQAARMVSDPRAKSKLRDFLVQWLRVDHATDIAKDPGSFPDFSAEVVSDLRSSLDLFLDDVVSSESADYRQLLLADSVYMNGRLAKFYTVEMPPDAPFQKVAWQPEVRAGVLTHPFLLTGFAYTSTSSPIHRGVFIARSVLGRTLRPPPEAVTPLAPDLHANLTTRERVALQTKGENCQSCHAMINPLGFTLENFDAVGRYRVAEQGKAIDADGGYLTRTGDSVKLSGVRELANYLADSEEAHTAFVQQLFQNLVKQPVQAYGPTALPKLRAAFVESNFNVRRLMVEIMVLASLDKPA